MTKQLFRLLVAVQIVNPIDSIHFGWAVHFQFFGSELQQLEGRNSLLLARTTTLLRRFLLDFLGPRLYGRRCWKLSRLRQRTPKAEFPVSSRHKLSLLDCYLLLGRSCEAYRYFQRNCLFSLCSEQVFNQSLFLSVNFLRFLDCSWLFRYGDLRLLSRRS